MTNTSRMSFMIQRFLWKAEIYLPVKNIYIVRRPEIFSQIIGHPVTFWSVRNISMDVIVKDGYLQENTLCLFHKNYEYNLWYWKWGLCTLNGTCTYTASYEGDPKCRRIRKKYLKYSYKFEILVTFKALPRDWIQRSQRRSHCWTHCLKPSTEMLSRATSDYRWTYATSAKRLPSG